MIIHVEEVASSTVSRGKSLALLKMSLTFVGTGLPCLFSSAVACAMSCMEWPSRMSLLRSQVSDLYMVIVSIRMGRPGVAEKGVKTVQPGGMVNSEEPTEML